MKTKGQGVHPVCDRSLLDKSKLALQVRRRLGSRGLVFSRLMWGVWFRVSGFGSRVSGLGFRVLVFGFRGFDLGVGV